MTTNYHDTIHSANQIFLMDPWWNPAAEMQAIDRTHRLGQYRPIRAVRFIAENTVEERILQLQEKKRLVFDGTVGRWGALIECYIIIDIDLECTNLTSLTIVKHNRDAASLKMLTVDDMKSLFTWQSYFPSQPFIVDAAKSW